MTVVACLLLWTDLQCQTSSTDGISEVVIIQYTNMHFLPYIHLCLFLCLSEGVTPSSSSRMRTPASVNATPANINFAGQCCTLRLLSELYIFKSQEIKRQKYYSTRIPTEFAAQADPRTVCMAIYSSCHLIRNEMRQANWNYTIIYVQICPIIVMVICQLS